MKRWLLCCMTLMMLFLSACGGDRPYEVKQEGQTFFVNPVERTVSWEGNDEGSPVVYNTGWDQETDWVELTYPDGSTFRRYWQDGLQYESVSDDYDAARYPSGDVLLKALGREVLSGGSESESWMVGCGIGVLFLGLGGFYALLPQWALERRTGGASAGVAPSPVAVKLTRLLGLLGVAIGGAILIASLLAA